MKKITVKYIVLVMVLFVLVAGKVSAYQGNGQDPFYNNWWWNYMNYYQPQMTGQAAQPASAAATTMAPAPAAIPARSSEQQLSADEWKMIELVNQERAANGLQPLQVDLRLVGLAREKAQDMIVNNYFDHQSPTLGSPFDQMKRAGIQYLLAGENLAGSPTVERAHAGLMNSPSHRANILNARYNHIGVGVIEGGRYGKMFVQHFIQK